MCLTWRHNIHSFVIQEVNDMRKVLLFSLCLFLLTGMMAFSAGKGEEAGTETEKKELDVLYFVGGMGEMANYAVEKLKANNPGADISLEYNHKAHDVLRNRMMAGNPPDVFNINKGLYSHYGAIAEGLLGSVEFILDAPALDYDGTLGDRIIQTNLDGIGYVDGTHYVIPEVSYLGGFWYDEKLMSDLGIDVSDDWTWDEFMDACAVIKENGITPFAYLGSFAHEYPLNYYLNPMIAALDYDTYVDIQNLVPGAWDSPAVREALSRIEEMRDKDYIWPASVGASTEVQMEFAKRKIGFYPCGSWLKAEMADSWPEDFNLQFFPVPGKNKASGTNYVYSTDLVSAIPSDPKNKELTIEYYQYLLSDKDVITNTIRDNQFVMPLVGFAEDFGNLLPNAVTDAVRATNDRPTFMNMLGLWYSELPDEIGNAINALVAGDQGIDQFIQRVEDKAKRVRNDDSIPKYEY
jgi:N-acetylglucosamine transport system substrate-binding protein